jgi:type III secretion system OrgA/MxiK family protein
MISQRLRILLDPLSYCDRGRIPYVGPHTAAAVRAALNRRLMRDFQLLPAPATPQGGLEREVLDNWTFLRRSAYLIGAYRRRNAVLQQIGFQHCDPGLQRFLQLKLPAIEQQGAACSVDEGSLLRQGCEILEPWLRPLHAAWRRRLELLFPESSSTWFIPGDALPDRSLIYLAIHYAKTT